MRFAAIILSNTRKVALPTGIGISMKIAQIAPLYEAVPPKLYGGTERIVAHLSNALVELGHQVTLFASADADTRATLVPVRDQAIRLDPSLLQSNLAAHLSMLHELHLRRHAFDLLHFHVDLIHFPLFEDFAARTVTTLHGRLDLKDLVEVYSRWHDYPLVSISDDQRKPLANANWAATIPHGLADEVYSFTESPGDRYLAFLGRISPEKRPDRAISIAKRLGMRLKMAAKVDAVDAGYFRDEIKPLLNDPLIEGVRFKALARRNKRLGLWAAERLGRTGTEAESYAKVLAAIELQHHSDAEVASRVQRDLEVVGVSVSEAEIRHLMGELLAKAIAEIKDGR